MKTLKCINSIIKNCLRYKVTFLLILYTGATHIWAQEVKTSTTNTQESTIYDQMQEQSDSLVENPNHLSDMPPEEWEAFDPSTVPEAVLIPEADWVFEVPFDVKNISTNVGSVGAVVRIHVWSTKHGEITFGKSRAEVQLVNGAYNGKIIFGVKHDEESINSQIGYTLPPKRAKYYSLSLYLIGPDNTWYYPGKEQLSPPWRMADASQPFNAFYYLGIPETYSNKQ